MTQPQVLLALSLSALAACSDDPDPYAVTMCNQLSWATDMRGSAQTMCEAACQVQPTTTAPACTATATTFGALVGCSTTFDFAGHRGCCIVDTEAGGRPNNIPDGIYFAACNPMTAP